MQFCSSPRRSLVYDVAIANSRHLLNSMLPPRTLNSITSSDNDRMTHNYQHIPAKKDSSFIIRQVYTDI